MLLLRYAMPAIDAMLLFTRYFFAIRFFSPLMPMLFRHYDTRDDAADVIRAFSPLPPRFDDAEGHAAALRPWLAALRRADVATSHVTLPPRHAAPRCCFAAMKCC